MSGRSTDLHEQSRITSSSYFAKITFQSYIILPRILAPLYKNTGCYCCLSGSDSGEGLRDKKLGHTHKVYDKVFLNIHLSSHWTEPFHIWNIITSKHNFSFPNNIPKSLTLERVFEVKN